MTNPSSTDPYRLGDVILSLHDAPDNALYDLEFHLKTEDYLGLVAGSLGMFIDDYANKGDNDSKYKTALLRKIQKDLAKLHDTHTLVPKKNSD